MRIKAAIDALPRMIVRLGVSGLFPALLVPSLAVAAKDTSVFEENSHCVAYRAQKTMFYVATTPVVGKNCDVSAQVLPEVGGLYRIEVNIPIKSFSSGDTSRDEAVAKTLQADVRPELVFRTKAMTVEQWRNLFKQGKFDLDGDLSIGEKNYPIKLKAEYVDRGEVVEVKGISQLQFKDLELSPPKVVAGIVAQAKQDLELLFQLESNRILGADTIKPDLPTTTKTPPPGDK
jgi:hypothetical protein